MKTIAVRVLCWVLLLGMWGACSTPSEQADVSESEQTGAEDPETDTEEEAKVVLTAANVRPHGYPLSEQGVSPDAVLFRFARPIVESGQKVTDDTRIRVVPDTPGTLVFTGPDTLKFTPTVGFLPDTDYTVEVMKVQTRDEPLSPTKDKWTARFKTPPLSVVRLAVRNIDPVKKKAELELVFSGPIKQKDIQKKVRFQFAVPGSPAMPMKVEKFSPAKKLNKVNVLLTLGSSKAKGTISARIDSGYRSALDSTRMGAKGAHSLEIDMKPKAVNVESVHLVEGTNRFYIEVICHDEGSSKDRRWMWSRSAQRSFRVSPRCQLTEEAVERAVHISPAVTLSATPSKGGFRLSGPLAQGEYTLTIDAGAGTIDGGGLLKAVTKTLSVPALSPSLSFASKGRYLPKNAWKNVAIQHRNVTEVQLSIRHIPQKNLVFWVSGQDERADERTSNLIFNEKVPVQGTVDQSNTSWLNIREYVPNAEKGIYALKISSGRVNDTARLLLTDLNLVAKMPRAAHGKTWGSEVKAWAMDMHTGNRRSGVTVDAIRPSGKLMGSCKTTGDGSCIIQLPEDSVDKAPPMALIAYDGNDHTYLKFSDLRTPVSEFEVGGEPYVSDRKYLASLYGDRDVFRPGETAHLSAIVRNVKNVAPDEGLPVQLELYDPQGKKVREKKLKTNDAGMLTWDVGFSDYARTGRYRVDARVGKKKVGGFGFSVEEFVPERMEVEASVARAHYLDSESVNVDVSAKYLFGGSAEGSRYEMKCSLAPFSFKPEEAKQWTFGVRNPGRAVDLGTVSGKLGEEGKGSLQCKRPKMDSGFFSAARLVANVDVFEAGSGRTTTTSTSVPVHPEKYYVGLDAGVSKVEGGKSFTVSGIVVDWLGKPYKDLKEVQLRMYRMESEWDYVWDEEEGTERYRRYLREVADGRETVAVKDGKFSYSAKPSSNSNKYMVRVIAGNTRTDLVLDGAWGDYWWDEESVADSTPRPLKPKAVSIDLPGTIEVGESVPVKFKIPYKGKALLSVETNQVIRSEWVDVDAGLYEWSFTLGEFNPNVYVSALVVKDPHLDSAETFIPDRAFGVESVRVRPSRYIADVSMQMPESVRSNSTLDVEVNVGKATGPTYVTVAAVDVGILSLTGFQPPDPIKDVFPKRRLGVETFETIGWAIHLQGMGNTSSTGGDGDFGGDRVQMVKPVSLWSGMVKADASGKAKVSLDIPQYRGKLRVMAVAASGDRIGSASQDVIVKDPLVVQTTLPRFFTEGDEAEVPVFLTNMSGKTQKVTVEMSSEWLQRPGSEGKSKAPPIAFTGAKKATFSIPDGENKTAVFRVRVLARTGAAQLKVRAKAGELVSEEVLDVPFESTGPRSRSVEMLELTGGEVDLASKITGWVEGTERTSLWLTNNPYGESFAHLKYLIRYPYGCVEQTTSSTRPLLFASSILGATNPELANKAKIDDMVAHGVDRLMRMQTPSGGFSYWIGGDTPNLWGTAYATHMLLDAQKAGYSIPEENLANAVAFIEKRVSMGDDQNTDRHSYTPSGDAYMHYVLARAGKGRKAQAAKALERIKSTTSGSEKERVYMLKAALYLAGDRRFEKDLKNPDVSALVKERKNDWSFYSDLRRRGFMLSVYADLFGKPTDGNGARLVRLVADGLAAQRRSRYYTTQELVWGVTGLGKVVLEGSKKVSGTLMVNGSKRAADDALGTDRIWTVARASERESLTLSTPKGTRLFMVVNSEGVKEGATWEYGANSLMVGRTYRDMDGRVIDFNKHALGDMVYVEISVKNMTRSAIQNVALVDRIPAGWEIENPRLKSGTRPDWVDSDELWAAQHMNLRDDRLEMFGELAPGRSVRVVYAVRAVTAGTFTIPPVEVEAMYDPERWGRSAGREVTIHGPWQDFYL